MRQLFAIGNGTSYHTVRAAAFLYGRLATPREPTIVPMTAAEFWHYRPALDDGDALLAISASGEFREAVSAVESVGGRIPTVGIVHVPGSALTRLARHVLVAAGGPSSVPVMTKTFASTLTLAYLLLSELLGGERADTVAEKIATTARSAGKAIERATVVVPDLAARLSATEHFFVAGGGGACPAALEAALKLKEMALVHAEGVETWEMETGPATLIGPRTCVITLELEGPGLEAIRRLARHCADWGAPVIEVATEAVLDDAPVLPLPAGAAEDFASLVAVPPIALLAFEVARRKGLDPPAGVGGALPEPGSEPHPRSGKAGRHERCR